MNVATYLFLNGNCAEAMQFYAQVTGGTLHEMFTFGNSSIASSTPPEWHDKIMHATLTVGTTTLFASDGMQGRYEKPAGFSVSIGVDTPEAADRVFQALSVGGSITFPIQETFWASRFGTLTDRYGTPWMVNCEKPAQS